MRELLLITSAYVAGLLAAAPVGPVNMVLIRRGLLTRWTRALWVALGSVSIEIGYVAVGLWGGPRIIGHLRSPTLRHFAGLGAAIVVMIVGLVILRKALKHPTRVLPGTEETKHEAKVEAAKPLWRDVATGAALTVINPATFGYWIGAGPQLLDRADVTTGSPLVWAALVAAGSGLVSWFLFVALLIRLRPERVSPRFFHGIDLACGTLLTILGAALAVASA